MRGIRALGLIVAVAAVARAAETGSIVKEIDIQSAGTGSVDHQYVAAHTSIRVGDELDRGAMRRDTRALLDTGRFFDVEIHAETATGGVRVVYQLRPRLILAGDIEVWGATHLSPRKIRKALELKPGDPVDDQILQRPEGIFHL